MSILLDEIKRDEAKSWQLHRDGRFDDLKKHHREILNLFKKLRRDVRDVSVVKKRMRKNHGEAKVFYKRIKELEQLLTTQVLQFSQMEASKDAAAKILNGEKGGADISQTAQIIVQLIEMIEKDKVSEFDEELTDTITHANSLSEPLDEHLLDFAEMMGLEIPQKFIDKLFLEKSADEVNHFKLFVKKGYFPSFIVLEQKLDSIPEYVTDMVDKHEGKDEIVKAMLVPLLPPLHRYQEYDRDEMHRALTFIKERKVHCAKVVREYLGRETDGIIKSYEDGIDETTGKLLRDILNFS